MPSIARMPASSYARAAASGKKYMSLQQVMPPRSISAAPSSVPSWTNSGATNRPSRGQMCSSSQGFSGTSSAMPRSSVIAACVCALTRPGISTCVGQRDVRRAARNRDRRPRRAHSATMRPPSTISAWSVQRARRARPERSSAHRCAGRRCARRSSAPSVRTRAQAAGHAALRAKRRAPELRREYRRGAAPRETLPDEKKAPRHPRGFSREEARQRRTTPSPLTSTSTRRFGARHAISAFSAFWLQTTPGTGCVLPMPSVSILSRGTPLLTR